MLRMYCKDRRGVCVHYQEKDLRHGINQGYLRREGPAGAGQVIKEGVLHRGPAVGAIVRGGGPEVGEGAGSGTGGRQRYYPGSRVRQ